MNVLLIHAATRRETTAFIDAAGGRLLKHPACAEFYEGTLGSWDVVVAVTGIGKVSTAMGLTMLIDRYRPRLVTNTGCAGAYPEGGLTVGDLAVATTETYADEGVETPAGFLSLEQMGLPVSRVDGVPYYNEIPLSDRARRAALSFARERGIVLNEGKFLSVSTCSGTDARGRALARSFDAICENMEGAAAAHVCLCHGVDCLEIRGVSNLVETRDLSRWNIPLAMENVQKFILEYIPTLSPEPVMGGM